MRAERARGATAPTPGVRLDRELRQAYLRIVEQHAGLRLTEHQARDLELHVGQLMAASAYADPLALYTALAAGARRDLLDDLAAHLTIGETHFFRVQPQIDALREVVLPEIVGRNASQRRIRAWSAGCSTGEEPYTVAILLREQLLAPESWDVQLLGTDINEPALEVARRATYGNWSFRGTTEEVRRRYFKPEGPRWRLVDPVRRMVQFAHLNLLAEPPARSAPGGELAARTSHLDLILCRNVTIYFGPEAVQRVYRRFAEALVDGGWLVLGPSDPTPAQPCALEPVCVPGAVLWRRPAATFAAPPAAPATPPAAPPRPTPLRTTRSG